MIGQTLSHYKVLEKLGEGGMGVVYKAEDTRLKRLVALKFLPAHLAASEADKARFMQEAQAAASLSHPNICTIFGIDEYNGQMFFAMEFVEGQTLRERMNSLALRQAIDIAIQVADGLAAAHEKGIVHRDIKPENIMIRKDDMVQIMDFGLAKLKNASSKVNRLTKEGSTVGTAGYMSPEQVLGQEADHRSDIFSLGVLMYEMFTGHLPFRGIHETALAYEIVNVDAAPMSSLKPEIDPNLDAVVLDCLEKDPKERCQSVAEVARDLRRIKRESTRQRHSRITASVPAYANVQNSPGRGSGSVSVPTQMAHEEGSSIRPARWPFLLAALFFLTTLALLAYHFLSRNETADRRVVQALILPPEKNEFNTSNGGHLAISPDGFMIVFSAADSTGVDRLWVRSLSTVKAIPLQGTESGTYPFWSEDSRSIAFFASGKLKKIDSHGGPTQTICDAPDGRGGAWNKEGVIVFTPGPFNPLFKVSAAGGTPVQITRLDSTKKEASHRWPQFLPDGDHFLFVNQTGATATDSDLVQLGSLTSSTWSPLFKGNSNVCYASGRLMFERQGTLMAQPFDLGSLSVTADAVPIAERVVYNSSRSRGIFSVSQNGILVYQSGENLEPEIGLFDRSGRRVARLGERGSLRLRFSPDGRKFAYDLPNEQQGLSDIWVYNLARGISSRLTFDASTDIVPTWSPRGDSILFSSNRGGRFALFLKSADGTGNERQLASLPALDLFATDWSKDGRMVSVTSFGDPKSRIDLWKLSMSGEPKLTPFLRTEFNEWVGRYSPDGRWIAYQSDETGKYEIYVRFAGGEGGKWQVSSNGGASPFWSPDGRQIMYTSADRKLVSAYVNGKGSTMLVDSLSTLFDLESKSIVGNVNDASPDGRSFLARISDTRAAIASITLVVNWDEALKKE